jgi:hypothetical protein
VWTNVWKSPCMHLLLGGYSYSGAYL